MSIHVPFCPKFKYCLEWSGQLEFFNFWFLNQNNCVAEKIIRNLTKVLYQVSTMLLVSEGNNLIMLALVFVIPEYAIIYKEKGANMLKYPVWMCVKGAGLKINLNSLQNFETKYQLLLNTLFIHFLYFSPSPKNKGKKILLFKVIFPLFIDTK